MGIDKWVLFTVLKCWPNSLDRLPAPYSAFKRTSPSNESMVNSHSCGGPVKRRESSSINKEIVEISFTFFFPLCGKYLNIMDKIYLRHNFFLLLRKRGKYVVYLPFCFCQKIEVDSIVPEIQIFRVADYPASTIDAYMNTTWRKMTLSKYLLKYLQKKIRFKFTQIEKIFVQRNDGVTYFSTFLIL